MKYIVLAQAFSREKGKVAGNVREEIIDTETNKLFKNSKNIMDIKIIYEAFWNDLNQNSKEVVFVQSIRREVD